MSTEEQSRVGSAEESSHDGRVDSRELWNWEDEPTQQLALKAKCAA